MMTPVGRLILVRSVDKRELVDAMIWVTFPALVGPLLGPPLGGFITTFISWHWIFLINMPIGIAGIVLATIYIEDVRAQTPDPFDPRGAALAGIGIGGLAFGGSLLGMDYLPLPVVLALIASAPQPPTPTCVMPGAAGAGARPVAAANSDHARRGRRRLRLPLRHRRDAVPAAAAPATRLRAHRVPVRADHALQRGRRHGDEDRHPDHLRRFGFKRALTVNALVSAPLVAVCATFTPGVPFAWIVGVLVVGGFFRSLEFTSINTIAYADVDAAFMSRATSLVAVASSFGLGRRGDRRAGGRSHAARGDGREGDHRRRFPAGLYCDRADRRLVGVHLLAVAA